MQIIFRVDSSLQMGTGHVMRCLTLAQVLKNYGAKVEFICRKHDGNLINKIRLSGFNVFELEFSNEDEVDKKLLHSSWLGNTQKKDAYECIKILQFKKIDWLIVDHYAIDLEWQSKLKYYCNRLMVIDDLADRVHLCDTLVDQTFGRERNDYISLVPRTCELLLGSKYALLRPEFAKWRMYSIKRREKAKLHHLFINMGGSDIYNITCKILQSIQFCELPHSLKISIIMGKMAPNLNEVFAAANSLPYDSDVIVDTDNMAQIMANSDLAIGASGSSTWERCCLGLPTIQLVIAENQKTISKFLAEKGAIKTCKNIKEVSSLIKDSKTWMKDVSLAAQQVTDGIGSSKIANKIMNIKL